MFKKNLMMFIFILLFFIYFIFSGYVSNIVNYNNKYQTNYISEKFQEVMLVGQNEYENQIIKKINKEIEYENSFIYYELFFPTQEINIMIYDGDYKYLENKEYIKGSNLDDNSNNQILVSETIYKDNDLNGVLGDKNISVQGVYSENVADANNIQIIIPVQTYLKNFNLGFDDIVINSTNQENIGNIKNDIMKIIGEYDKNIEIIDGIEKSKNFKDITKEVAKINLLKNNVTILVLILFVIIGLYQIKLKSYEYGVRYILGISDEKLLLLVYKDYLKDIFLGIVVGYALYCIIYLINSNLRFSLSFFQTPTILLNIKFIILMLMIINLIIWINYLYFMKNKNVILLKGE